MNAIKVIGAIAAVTALALILPALSVAIGWLVGAVVALFFGGLLADGLNVLFGTERFASGDIPAITAVLSLLALFLVAKYTKKEAE
ncbi:hypothetical protein D7Z54_32380 [Salibacterium salarium]|uniref:Transglycosylase associated protein n=1 Tax=Salibacterium salarium TaxID=284579 RepID=A0A3R9QF64_9BACI|nr:hypothetical protein [Salibacterium salarium]RSL29236.1 hypothetical protein D7Z54_32380 [Salibacterium salarium]